MKRKPILFIAVMFFLCTLSVASQELTVNGKVISEEDGSPLPGVNIVLKGTQIGTMSDFDGEYSIKIPKTSSVLVFSSLGFSVRELQVDGRSIVNVALVIDSEQLDEVVVTAFGIERKKKALGYSVQEIKGDRITEAGNANVVSSLKGKVAGLYMNGSSGGPGGSSNVIIRGSSSLVGNNQPLYVVDGVPIDNSTLDPAGLNGGRDYGDGIGNINPNDIENISVLKGPSASALYGARGANGVILLTTKKGKRKLGISINSNITMDTPNVTPTFQTKWGGGYGGWNLSGTTVVDGVEYPLYGNSLYDMWGEELDGRLVVLEHMPELGPVPYSSQPDNRNLDFYRTGSTSSTNVSVSGGSEKTLVRVSLSDMRNSSILPSSDLGRQSISINFSSSVTDKLLVEGRVNYIKQNGENRPELGISSGGANVANSLAQLPPFIKLDWLKDWKNDDGSMRNYQQRNPPNPYWITNELLSKDSRNRIIGYLKMNYQFTKWLNLQLRSGTDLYTDKRYERTGIGTTGASTIRGNVKNDQFLVQEENHDIILSAAGDLNSNFTGSVSLGANHLNNQREILSVFGSNLIVDDLYHISNALNVTTRNSISRKKMNSVYALGQIGYKNYLFMDLTGRNDWSSTLGVGNQSFFYPSASLSFAFTDAFKVKSDFLTFGKFRASIAQAGNDADPFLTKSGYSISSQDFNGLRMASFSNKIPLQDLKNELTESWEVGGDLRFFKNRVGVDFTYYNASTKNQIVPIPLSQASGYVNRVINAGEIQNKGFELMLNFGVFRNTNGFNWDATINLSHNKSHVISLSDDVESLTLLSQSYANIEARPGEPYGNIVGWAYLKNDKGEKILNEQGKPQKTATTQVLGNVQPDFLGGFYNKFSFKGISLGGLIDFRKGGQIFSHTRYRQMANGTGKFTEHREEEMFYDGVIENPDGTFRSNDVSVGFLNYHASRAWGNYGEEFVIDADYVALREATLEYAFNDKQLAKTPFSTLKLSLVGRNLLYLYRDPMFKAMGVAPETAFNNSTAAQGLESMTFPTTRSLGLNISLSF